MSTRFLSEKGLGYVVMQGDELVFKMEMFRVDSIRIAEKLGFAKKREYRCNYFPLRNVK